MKILPLNRVRGICCDLLYKILKNKNQNTQKITFSVRNKNKPSANIKLCKPGPMRDSMVSKRQF